MYLAFIESDRLHSTSGRKVNTAKEIQRAMKYGASGETFCTPFTHKARVDGDDEVHERVLQ